MAGIIFACSVPHPPIIVPDIGRGEERKTSATIQAMEKLSSELAEAKPQTMLVISPHGALHHNAMGVLTAKSSTGNLRSWGVPGPDWYFNNDLDFVSVLEQEAKAANIPLKTIGERGYELDHGVMVPFYFLSKGVKDVPLVPLTFSLLPLTAHFAFGQALKRCAERVGKRVALIASGDLSHRLLPTAPAGYDPMGKVFDEKLVDAISHLDTKAVLSLDPNLIERAGECGLRSIVILLGAIEGLKAQPQVLSYEGPFGVGYMVASFKIEDHSGGKKEELPPLVCLAKETVESYVREGKVPQPPKELTPEMREQAGVFVSLKKQGELRGCIGTFEPTRANVAEEIIANAISSATRDPRFPPVNTAELPHLSYSVDVLTKPEPVESQNELDPKRYGVIVESGGQRGLLLPDLEGVNTVEEQISICRQKGGILPHEPVKLYRFEVKRYI
jgi:AmmeMemoRadiSam system protein A/AmmeMemoRadiSam system protein B